MRHICQFAVAMAALLVAACDTLPNLRLHNGTGRSIDLKVAKPGQSPKAIHLAPGRAGRIWNIYGPKLYLTVEGCERLYNLPPMELNFPWRRPDGEIESHVFYPVEVRLEPDFSLSLLPSMPRKHDKDWASRAAALADHGFPLQPTPKTCP